MERGARRWKLVLTCEHASRALPRRGRARFGDRDRSRLITSHRGWDPGAASVARSLAGSLGAPLFLGGITRLVVDLNRSPGNPAVIGALARALPVAERARLIEEHHTPHWQAIFAEIDAAVSQGDRVLHVAVHSFAPRVKGKARTFDVGLLYDPRREPERGVALAWQRALAVEGPSLRVRRNQPYQGRSDGLPTALRRRFPTPFYSGIELELGQALLREAARRRRLTRVLSATLSRILDDGSD